MHRRSAFPHLAMGFAAAFLVACGGEMPLTAPDIAGPAFDEGSIIAYDEAGEPYATSTLYPNYGMFSGEAETPAGLMMSVQAEATHPDINVGVIEQAGTVYLGATGNWTIRDRANGVVLMTGTAGAPAAVTLAQIPEKYWYLQVTCGSPTVVSEWKGRADAAGYFTILDDAPGFCVRLLIGRPSSGAWGVRVAFKNELIAKGLAKSDGFWKEVTFGNALYRVTRGTQVVDNINPVAVTTEEGSFVTIGTSPTSSRQYRGAGAARVNSSATLAGINTLPMEEYLWGVVPRELGPNAFPEIEAQKAQAVAARTYAMVGLGKRASDGYDLRATTSDQVYGGYQDEHPVSTAAVNATRGVVAVYDGKMISTLYSSTTGGHTADSEEAYANAIPYLRGVPDAQRGQATEHVPTLEVFRAHQNPLALRATAEGDYESDWSKYHRWTFEWTADEISAAISSWHGAPVGTVHAINVTERGRSGRALRIEYVTDAGTLVQTKDLIRSSFRYINASGGFTSMPSTLFFVEPVRQNGQFTGGYRVFGGGWGHGVGLSQTGAVGMAEKGASYDEILKYYYQGIGLEARY